jgi:hypothetical protein
MARMFALQILMMELRRSAAPLAVRDRLAGSNVTPRRPQRKEVVHFAAPMAGAMASVGPYRRKQGLVHISVSGVD